MTYRRADSRPPSPFVELRDFIARPLPKESFPKVACVHCRQTPARWDLLSAGVPQATANPSCSACLLYNIPSMREQRASIDGLIHEVEIAIGVIFARSANGCLQEEHDADRIAFGIVAGNKVSLLRTMLGRTGGR